MLLVLLAGGGIVLVLELAFAGMATTQIGCTACHVSGAKAEELSDSPHADRSCRSCHAPGGVIAVARMNVRAASNLISYMTGRRYQTTGVSFSEVCRSCHAETLSQTVTVRGVRISHAAFVAARAQDGQNGELRSSQPVNLECSYCHSDAAHVAPAGGTTSLEVHSSCGTQACHDGVAVSDACDLCHTQRSSTTGASSPHPPDWGSTHGMGDLQSCSTCHEAAACKECHGVSLPHDPNTFAYAHGAEANQAGSACYACHEEASCSSCHAVPMPHADDYLTVHGRDAVDRGTEVCAKCHLESGCLRCHARHLHIGVAPEIIEKLEKASGGQGGAVEPSGTSDAGTVTSP